MNSTLGRPRSLTDAQVEIILAWYHSPRSIPAFARHMKLPASTIRHCIRVEGHYKQASPELRADALRQHRGRLQRLHADGWL